MLIKSAALMYVVVEDKARHFYDDDMVVWVPDIDYGPAGVRAVEKRSAKGLAPVVSTQVLHLFAQSVMAVSQKTDANGAHIYFVDKAHYHCVYRLAVDYGFAKEDDYKGFSSLMESLNLKELGREVYDSESVRKANVFLYASPFDTWSETAYMEKNMSTKLGKFRVRFQLTQDIKTIFEFALAMNHITI